MKTKLRRRRKIKKKNCLIINKKKIYIEIEIKRQMETNAWHCRAVGLVQESGLDEFLQEEFDVAQFGFLDAQWRQNGHIPVVYGQEHGAKVFHVGAHQTQRRPEVAQRLRFCNVDSYSFIIHSLFIHLFIYLVVHIQLYFYIYLSLIDLFERFQNCLI